MSNTDIGPQALKLIASIWQVDAARSIWGDNGFDWWPGDFRVSVGAYRRQDGQAREMWQVSIRTDFLKDIPVDDSRFVSLTATLSQFFTSTYAWVYPTADVWGNYGESGTRPKLWLASNAYATLENAHWLPGFLARMSIMQPVNAQVQAHRMSEMLTGGVPDVSHPGVLRTAGFDEILEVAAQVYVPIGQEASRWIGTGEFSNIADDWGSSDQCFGNGDAHGLTLETPFGDNSALIRLRTDEKHPQLGHGLLGTLQLPHLSEAKAIDGECAFLNFLEATSWTDIPLLGCWHPHKLREDQYSLAFSLFIPNALYQSGIAAQTTLWLLQRARWARREMWPNLEDKPMHEVLRNRMARMPAQVKEMDESPEELEAWKKLNDRRRILAGPAYHTSPEDREAWRRHIERQSKLAGYDNPSKDSDKKE